MCWEAGVLLPALLLAVLLLLGAEQGHDQHTGIQSHPGAALPLPASPQPPAPAGQARGLRDHCVPGRQETLHRLVYLQKKFNNSQCVAEVSERQYSSLLSRNDLSGDQITFVRREMK